MEKYIDEKSKIVRESIGEAIFRLLKEVDFTKISVCDICRIAGVGRTTYYRYYGNKTGKEDAILNWFINRWDALLESKNIIALSTPITEIDEMFKKYLYMMKNEILLLAANNLLHIWESFILHVYGSGTPADEDLGNYYFKYVSAGLWIGLSRSLIDRNFSEDVNQVSELFMKSFLLTISNASASETTQ